MTRSSYNLIDEPWVLVRAMDGSVSEVSLRGAFGGAHQLRGLVGELPTQEAAILRLMLAVLHRIFPAQDAARPTDVWRRLWLLPTLPMADVDLYLSQHGHRFDLLDESAPFFQVSDLRTASGSTSGLAKLIADVPDRHQFFTTRAGEALTRLSFAEAARWLVHCQAYDPSGIKSGAVGDDRVKGGRGYPIGTGWAGALGLLVAEGASLRETLLLNLVLSGGSSVEDRPVWERPPLGAAPEPMHPEPTGPADLYTWPIRRIRLSHDGSNVVDALICNGDAIAPHNRMATEAMTAWRHSPNQEKKLGGTVYMPLTHQPERAVWRGLEGIMGMTEAQGVAGAKAAPHLAAGLVSWLATLRGVDALPEDYPFVLRAIGVIYGSNNSVISGVIDDGVAMRLSVLSDPPVRACAVDAVRDARNGVDALRALAGNLARAAGRDHEGPRARSAELGFHLLDGPYRRWLVRLSGSGDLDEQRAAWQRRVRRELSQAANQLVADSGDTAWVGRETQLRDGTNQWIDSSLAHRWFGAALAKALPLAYDNTVQPADSDTAVQEATT